MTKSAQQSLCATALIALLAIVLPSSARAAKKPLNGKIAFETERDLNKEVYVMNADGSAPARLTANRSAVDGNAAWSPDGSKIAFNSTRDGNLEIYVMNANGSNETRLTQQTATDAAPAWSPDGARIAFQSARDGNFEIYVMNADGSNQIRLTNNAASDLQPSWSPDGQRIVFQSDRDGNREIYAMNRDGSGQTRLTTNTVDDQAPELTPDGTKIVFARDQQVTVMNADGSNAVQLTSDGINFGPVVSPDGKKIAFTSTRDGNDEVYVMNFDGSNQVRLTNNTVLDANPSWQPKFSPSTIGVYRPTTGQWLLRNSNTSGTPDLTLTFGGQPGDLPVSGDWNGDGRDDIGIFRNGTFFLAVLKTTFTCSPCAVTTTLDPQPEFTFGQAGDRPIAGDWDGDGRWEVGVYRDATTKNSTFLLRLRQESIVHPCSICAPVLVTTFVSESHSFGVAGDLPVAGDWDGDGKTTIGVFHTDPGGVFLLTNDFAEANAGASFGTLGDLPVAGDWSGVNADRVGVFHPSSAKVSLATQLFLAPDIVFSFGAAGDLPVAGRWLAVTP